MAKTTEKCKHIGYYMSKCCGVRVYFRSGEELPMCPTCKKDTNWLRGAYERRRTDEEAA
jgi:hypothetical protein